MLITRYSLINSKPLTEKDLKIFIINLIFAKDHDGYISLFINDGDYKEENEKIINTIIDKTDSINHIINPGKKIKLYQEFLDDILLKGLAEKKDHDIVFKNNISELVLNDLIQGKINIDTSDLKEFPIYNADKGFTDSFVNAIDDFNIKTTHIIRENTVDKEFIKEFILFNSLNWNIPGFAHITIKNSDQKHDINIDDLIKNLNLQEILTTERLKNISENINL